MLITLGTWVKESRSQQGTSPYHNENRTPLDTKIINSGEFKIFTSGSLPLPNSISSKSSSELKNDKTKHTRKVRLFTMLRRESHISTLNMFHVKWSVRI